MIIGVLTVVAAVAVIILAAVQSARETRRDCDRVVTRLREVSSQCERQLRAAGLTDEEIAAMRDPTWRPPGRWRQLAERRLTPSTREE